LTLARTAIESSLFYVEIARDYSGAPRSREPREYPSGLGGPKDRLAPLEHPPPGGLIVNSPQRV